MPSQPFANGCSGLAKQISNAKKPSNRRWSRSLFIAFISHLHNFLCFTAGAFLAASADKFCGNEECRILEPSARKALHTQHIMCDTSDYSVLH